MDSHPQKYQQWCGPLVGSDGESTTWVIYGVPEPPHHLHLVIDITKITQVDINWMKSECRYMIPEIRDLYMDYNGIKNDYNKTVVKFSKIKRILPKPSVFSKVIK